MLIFEGDLDAKQSGATSDRPSSRTTSTCEMKRIIS
jgi:hypothetical protein